MIRVISWIAMVVVGLAIIVFAVANRSPLEIDLWPLPFTPVVPSFAVVLGAAFVGFVGGGIIAWLSAGGTRRRARQEHRRADTLEKDLETLKSRIDELDKSGTGPSA